MIDRNVSSGQTIEQPIDLCTRIEDHRAAAPSGIMRADNEIAETGDKSILQRHVVTAHFVDAYVGDGLD